MRLQKAERLSPDGFTKDGPTVKVRTIGNVTDAVRIPTSGIGVLFVVKIDDADAVPYRVIYNGSAPDALRASNHAVPDGLSRSRATNLGLRPAQRTAATSPSA